MINNYDIKYVLSSLEYSQKNKCKIYLSNTSGHRKSLELKDRLFHPSINLKSRGISRNTSVHRSTKSSLAKTREKLTSKDEQRLDKIDTSHGSSFGFEMYSSKAINPCMSKEGKQRTRICKNLFFNTLQNIKAQRSSIYDSTPKQTKVKLFLRKHQDSTNSRCTNGQLNRSSCLVFNHRKNFNNSISIGFFKHNKGSSNPFNRFNMTWMS